MSKLTTAEEPQMILAQWADDASGELRTMMESLEFALTHVGYDMSPKDTHTLVRELINLHRKASELTADLETDVGIAVDAIITPKSEVAA